MVVCCDNDIVVFGGQAISNFKLLSHDILNFKLLSHDVIWVYNRYTEQWRKHQTVQEVASSPVDGPSAVAIGACIYMFGGMEMTPRNITNALWMLARTQEGFHWSKCEYQSGVKLPSPRYKHRGWEYRGCLWIFEGFGPPLDIFLNECGDFALDPENVVGEGMNNQLLCYDSSTQKWTNPQCSGAIPSPRSDYGSTIIKDRAWLFGGHNSNRRSLGDLFQIDVYLYIWTQIESLKIKPNWLTSNSSLIAVSETELVLVDDRYEGMCYGSDVKIIDLTSQSWKQYTLHTDHRRYHSAVVSGVNRSVILTGGYKDDDAHGSDYTSAYHLMLEPKNLQQLAIKIVYNQRSVLP